MKMELPQEELKLYGVEGRVLIKSLTVGQESEIGEEVDRRTKKMGFAPVKYASTRLLNFCIEEAPFKTDMASLEEMDSALAEYIVDKYQEMTHPLLKNS